MGLTMLIKNIFRKEPKTIANFHSKFPNLYVYRVICRENMLLKYSLNNEECGITLFRFIEELTVYEVNYSILLCSKR